MGKTLNSSSQKIRVKKGSNIELSPDDRISLLPVDILVHILSFLTLKESAQTSVLSRRWMTLWIHVSSLNFEDINGLIRISRDRGRKRLEKERHKFISWVETVLHSHFEGDSSLNEFRVHFDLDESSKKEIDKWLRYAFAKRVQRLELNFSSEGVVIRSMRSYPFPKLLFDIYFGAATNRGFSRYYSIPHDGFNSLKELTLNSVNVTEEVFQLFLLKFPFLERLVVLGSEKLQNVEVSGSSLTLKYLEIRCCYKVQSIVICNSSLVSLIIGYTESLKVANAPRLTELHIYARYPIFPLYVFAQLSCCLSQLKVLLLNADRAEKIGELHGISEISNLKVLIINVVAWDDGSLLGVTSFLKFCPNLQKFVLELPWSEPSRDASNRMPNKTAKCTLKHLEVIEFLGYYGRSMDDELIKYFVENAAALKKVVVDPRNQTYVNPQNKGSKIVPSPDEVEEELAAIVRAPQCLEGLVPRHIELVIL